MKLALLAALLLPCAAFANGGTTATWTGGGYNYGSYTLFSDKANWSKGIVPPGNAYDISMGSAFYSGSNIWLTANVQINSFALTKCSNGLGLTWGFGGPYDLIIVSGKLTRDSSCSGQQTINVPLVTAAATNFDVDGTNGRLGLYSTLYVLGSYPVAFTKSGSGELDFYGANTWTGVAESPAAGWSSPTPLRSPRTPTSRWSPTGSQPPSSTSPRR